MRNKIEGFFFVFLFKTISTITLVYIPDIINDPTDNCRGGINTVYQDTDPNIVPSIR